MVFHLFRTGDPGNLVDSGFSAQEVKESAMKKCLAMCVLGLVGSLSAAARNCPAIQLSVWPTVQIFPEETEIRGLKLNLFYGYNEKVLGLDAGLISCGGLMDGIQVNVANAVAAEINGLQLGVLNVIGSGKGIQGGALNYGETQFTGIQVGLVNYTRDVVGVQIGLVNRCETIYGVQIGLANIIESSPLPFFPIVNAKF